MLKILRKYNKWILVIGGTLLMLAFLVQPALDQLGGNPGSRVVGRLDGRSIRASDYQAAIHEIHALRDLTMGYLNSALRLDEKEPAHWLLLKAEAREGGFMGEADDGAAWIPELTSEITEVAMREEYGQLADPRFAQFFQMQYGRSREQAEAEMRAMVESRLDAGRQTVASSLRVPESQVDGALTAARGVFRMIRSYGSAARLSDRLAAGGAKLRFDAAYADVLAIPASRFAAEVAEPSEADLQAHVDRFKDVRPGQGEFGVGYLLPARVKLEWLVLDAPAIMAAIPADAVEMNKRYLQNRRKYPGEFAAERARLEQEYKTEKLAQVMQEAHRVIQAGVLQATRRLSADGRYRKLPEDWESSRPKFAALAQEIVVQVRQGTGITIALPAVTVRDRWTTPQDLGSIPGFSAATFQSGNRPVGVAEAVMGVRELARPGEEFPVPIQVGLPLADTFFTDPPGSRYYLTVLAARAESAPESLDEVRERATTEYKELKAYESLVSRLPEWRSLAVSGGLEAVRDAAMPPEPGPDVGPPPPDERPAVATRTQVSREQMNPGDAGGYTAVELANVEPVRTAIMDAAAALDPLTPPAEFGAERATVAAAAPAKRAVVLARLTALAPLTRERYRAFGSQLAMVLQAEEMQEAATGDGPYSLPRLLARHEYVNEDGVRVEPPAVTPPVPQTIPGGG